MEINNFLYQSYERRVVLQENERDGKWAVKPGKAPGRDITTSKLKVSNLRFQLPRSGGAT